MPTTETLSMDALLSAICALPEEWHQAGSCPPVVFQALVKHAASRTIEHSMETGSGKTTLLFSHLSEAHKVFAVDMGNSLSVVRSSSLLNPGTVEFVEGFTQQTLPRFKFEHKLQLAMIDGPHGYPFPELEYYYIYPHLEENALLIVDDIQIRTIHNFFEFLKEDEMFELLEVVDKTAIFRRTGAPVFDPLGDNWWLQHHNKDHYPWPPPPDLVPPGLLQRIKRRVPAPIKRALKTIVGNR